MKHPRAYAERIGRRVSPAQAREVLSREAIHEERVLLETRISEGLPVSALEAHERRAIPELIADGLIDGREAIGGRVVPTLRGRLLADTVVHRILA